MMRRWLVLAALGVVGLAAAPAAALTLSAAQVNAAPGQTGVVVAVTVDDATGIAGGDVTLTFDPAVLTAKQVKGGDLVTGAGITVIPNLATAGQVKVSMAGATGIASGSGVLLNATFDVKAGASPGTYALTLRATLRDENGAALTATLRNGAIAVKAATASVPQIKVSATVLSFDSTKVGSRTQKTIVVSNTGKASLVISKISVGGADAAQFQVSPGPATVAAGGSRTVTVTFAPSTAGAKSATLSLAHNAAGSPTSISLKGKGIAAVALAPQLKVSATALSFDSTKVGSRTQKTIVVSNTGKASLTLSKISVGGTDAAQFQVSPGPATVAAGGSQTVTVTFAPSTAGAKSATLSLAHNAAGSPTTISLKGKGVAPPAGLQVSVGSAILSPGGTAVVPISISDAKGIAGGDLTLGYPAAVVTARQVKGGDLVLGAGIAVIPNTATAGQVKVAMAGATGIPSGSGELVNVSFEVKSGAAPGTYPLTLQGTLRDENGSAVPATFNSGTIAVKASAGKGAAGQPAAPGLGSNYPNPFNSTTLIPYYLAVSAPVRLTVYNLLGQPVRVLADQAQGPGWHQIAWDGRDEQGRAATSGVYLYQLRTDTFQERRSMLLVR